MLVFMGLLLYYIRRTLTCRLQNFLLLSTVTKNRFFNKQAQLLSEGYQTPS
jgi:CO dehydrogenase/acetyl-CoA synthase epsilon subunit